MLTDRTWERFRCEAERLGLPLVGVLALGHDAALFAAEPPPAAASHAVVVMQAGGAFWQRLGALRALDPALDQHPDPLDTFTVRMAARLADLLGGAHAGTRFPSASRLDFVALGEAAGLGRRSRMGQLVHPAYGLWTAARALFYVAGGEGVITPAVPLAESACERCAAPCIGACPAGAVRGEPLAERLDIGVSYRWRREHPGPCAQACEARLACPVGAEHRYPADFLAHSHRRAWSALEAAFGAPAAPAAAPRQGTLF